jgi:hypothetical protein
VYSVNAVAATGQGARGWGCLPPPFCVKTEARQATPLGALSQEPARPANLAVRRRAELPRYVQTPVLTDTLTHRKPILHPPRAPSPSNWEDLAKSAGMCAGASRARWGGPGLERGEKVTYQAVTVKV